MRILRKILLVAVVCLASSTPFRAQAPQPSTTVPRLLPVAGIFVPADGRPPAPVETVTLSVYADETEGTRIWEETQSVSVDASGRYSLLLGASSTDGLPLDIFASGEARWLSLRFERPGEAEGARGRLTSVPYALHAADADTLGGRPASAYLLAPAAGGSDLRGESRAEETSSPVVAPTAINTGLTNAVAKYLNNADTIGPSSIFENNSGDVGIGTGNSVAVGGSAAVDRLNIRFSNSNGAITGISLRNETSSATAYSGILFYDHTAGLALFQGYNNTTHEYRFNNIAKGAMDVFDGSFNFMIGGASRLFVASGGHVGIGTTTPSWKLSVEDPSNTGLRVVTATAGGTVGSFGGIGEFQIDAPNIPGGRFLVKENGRIGIGMPLFHDFSGLPAYKLHVMDSSNTGLRVQTDTAGGTVASFGGNGDFQIDASGVVGGRFVVQEGGNVGIGGNTPATRLQVFGDVRVGTSGTNGCIQRFDGTAIGGACSSDRRFKREITPFGAALNAVAALRPVHYYWRGDQFPDRHFGAGQSYGLIAQEVEQVLPELVVTNVDGYKAVDYSKLPLLTVQAIKELKADNDELKIQNDAMQSRISELERLLKQLLTERSRF